jgi:tRNA threonylcarbamoyladenosine biosynthesis protein TsaB
VAVGLGDRIIAGKQIDTHHGQAEALLPLVDDVMREAGQMPAALDLVVTTVGPGSFTGIRVGLAAARGITLATGARLIGVTSFDAVAAGATRSASSEDRFLLIALESRREDLYIQFLNARGNPLGEPSAVMPSALCDAANATIGAMPLLIAGDAVRRAAAVLTQRPHTRVLKDRAPVAVGALLAGLRLLRLGRPGTAPRPLYLRPADVTLSRVPRQSHPART